MIRKRPETGLLAGLWEFPSYETAGDLKELKEMIALQNQVGLDHLTPIGHINHVFSHLIWEIDIYKATVKNLENFKSTTHKLAYVKDEDFQQYALPVSHQKIYEAYVYHG